VSFNGVVSSGGAACLAPQRNDPEDSRQQQRRWWRIRFQNWKPLVLQYLELVEYTEGEKRSIERRASLSVLFCPHGLLGIEPGPPRYRGVSPTAQSLNNF